jgi:hypothetical protein
VRSNLEKKKEQKKQQMEAIAKKAATAAIICFNNPAKNVRLTINMTDGIADAGNVANDNNITNAPTNIYQA